MKCPGCVTACEECDKPIPVAEWEQMATRQYVETLEFRIDELEKAICWLCSGPVVKRHCKIICEQCGFVRDCSDP